MIDLKAYPNRKEIRVLLGACMWPDDERISNEFQAYIKDESRQLLGKIRNEQLVGLIGIIPILDREAELKHIAVLPAYRRQGIGKDMIDEYMQQYGMDSMTAETDKDAVGFYRNMGFQITSLGEKYPGVERFQCRLVIKTNELAEHEQS
ncbi:GNAT family N-acetyltransferase [Paenibacillus abyssi]|uniref:N-acetyltransferase domain-containing protein n=1 Tax=Paenibacillus abyssi TaxID=1340531 RepID=A0A917FZE9_9BACL|nr:N-acetyltransferase [Paenibacillus abyssi]GGG15178.1 hypothetical protein GCM10010916_35110 [Paenibacillus abyssi]